MKFYIKMSDSCPCLISLLYLNLRLYFKNFMDKMRTFFGHKPDKTDILWYYFSSCRKPINLKHSDKFCPHPLETPSTITRINYTHHYFCFPNKNNRVLPTRGILTRTALAVAYDSRGVPPSPILKRPIFSVFFCYLCFISTRDSHYVYSTSLR